MRALVRQKVITNAGVTRGWTTGGSVEKTLFFSMRSLAFSCCVALLVSLFGYPFTSGHAATTIVIETPGDEINTNALCSLREAIINANEDEQSGSTDCPAGSGVDVIVLPTELSPYELSIGGTGEDAARQGDLDIVNPLEIRAKPAAGATAATINANEIDRVFDVTQTTATLEAPFGVALQDLILREGDVTGIGAVGGGIQNTQDLELVDVVVRGNAAAEGGGIYNAGTLTADNVKVRKNESLLDGGGMFNDGGTLRLNGGLFDSNRASSRSDPRGDGGAIRSDGETSVAQVIAEGTVFTNNEAAQAGAILNESSSALVLEGVTFGRPGEGNSALIGNGGAILSFGSVTVSRSVFDGNDAADDGGGVFSGGGGRLLVTESEFLNNTAPEDGGAIFVGGTNFSSAVLDAVQVGLPGAGNSANLGGGLYAVANAEFRARGSSFVGNEGFDEGGAIWSDANVFLLNSTISGNTTDGLGGGIYNECCGDVTATAVTLHDNSAGRDAGNLWDESEDTGHATRFRMSIISGGSPNNCNQEDARYEDLGFNLTDDPISTACNLSTAGGSIGGENPRLGPLAFNGGSTLNHSLSEGSPALDAVDPGFCPPPGKDQRGQKRPARHEDRDARCDIGSFERNDAEGDVHPRCGLPRVICGTDGPDRLVGGPEDNEIYGGGGEDVCIGGGGNDTIDCGRGNDDLRGGGGRDRLIGRGGGDTLRGGRGRDVLRGGRGRDLLIGGPQRDVCRGGPGRDRRRRC
ncbi:MAG: choice-of-anchor Q domain-containing protein [Actinomycetota bacterium]